MNTIFLPTMRSLLLLFFVLFQSIFAYANELEEHNIAQTTLDNGLKIIVKTDSRAPVFISQLWYRVGASDEKRPITGISHMLEHMMFKGSNAYKSGEFSRIIARNGGSENAFTGKDYTAYYQKMHKSKLELAIKMEADRMRNLTFSDQALAKERQVVIEERRLRVEDNPNAKVHENLRLISFDSKGAYHSPVIGFQADLESYKLGDLRAWYETFYAPNNATLVVVGDVQVNEVMRLAKQYFGQYRPNTHIERTQSSATVLKGNSRTLKLKAKLPFYTLSFAAPSLKTAEKGQTAYALEMLAYVLDSGLSKTLVRKQQIVSSIGVDYAMYNKFDTLFILSFVAAQDIDNQAILKNIKTQVAELIDAPDLLENEMSHIKAQLEANFVFEQDRISTQAYYLGKLSTIGLDIDKLSSYVERMNDIQVEDVARVAKKYLNFADANTVELIPQEVK